MNNRIESIILVCLESFETEEISKMLHEDNWTDGAKRIFSEEIARRNEGGIS